MSDTLHNTSDHNMPDEDAPDNDGTSTLNEHTDATGADADTGNTPSGQAPSPTEIPFDIVYDDEDAITPAAVADGKPDDTPIGDQAEDPDGSPTTEPTADAGATSSDTSSIPTPANEHDSRTASEPDATPAAGDTEEDDHLAVTDEVADEILLKSYPTFALNHATLHDRKSGRALLDDVQLGFYSGRLYAVTTHDADQRHALLSVLGGLRRPNTGQVMLKSADLATMPSVAIRGHRIGLVPQRFAVRDDLDATSNLVYTMQAADRTFLRPMRDLAHDLLATVGFSAAATGTPAADLDMLDQRRLAIARAIACEATAVIVDAPTVSLDDAGSTAILTLLTTLAHDTTTPRCVIMVTDEERDLNAADERFEL